MVLVLDASIAVAWALRDDTGTLSARTLDRLEREPGLAPGLFWFEIRNVLIMNERRGRISREEIELFLPFVDSLPLHLDATPDSDAVLALARRHRLTVYDAAYLELARRRMAPLATLDRRLAAAAEAEGIALLD